MANGASQIDSAIDIVTPENIAFSYRVAGPFRRLPAFVIDLGILIGLHVVVAILAMFVGSFAGGITFAGVSVIFLIVWWFYGGLFETFMNGQTPGKWVMGLRVLTVDGHPINGLQAVLRNILRAADMMPILSLQIFDIVLDPLEGELMPPAYVIPTGILGLAVMTITARYQRLGDLVCGTMVVSEDRHWLTGLAKLDDERAAQLAEYIPPNFQVTRSMARTLANYVERRRFFSLPRRREVARHLAVPLLERFSFPADTSHDLLLCALYYRTFIADRGDETARQRDASPFAAAGPPPGAAWMAAGDPGHESPFGLRQPQPPGVGRP